MLVRICNAVVPAILSYNVPPSIELKLQICTAVIQPAETETSPAVASDVRRLQSSFQGSTSLKRLSSQASKPFRTPGSSCSSSSLHLAHLNQTCSAAFASVSQSKEQLKALKAKKVGKLGALLLLEAELSVAHQF